MHKFNSFNSLNLTINPWRGYAKLVEMFFSAKHVLDRHRKDTGEAKQRKILQTCTLCGSKTYNLRIHHSNECTKYVKGPHMWTEDEKKILSEKRKDFLRKNPEKHSWKTNKKFISEPCEFLKRSLKDNNINFIEEFSPLEDRHFSLDIAFS